MTAGDGQRRVALPRAVPPWVDAGSTRLPQPGAVLGSYQLVDIIGQGGMGVVYLAHHVKIGRRVAIKVLAPHCATNPTAVKRFFAEAFAVNRICHDNIIEITDFVEGGEHTFYVMEYLEGLSLHELLQDERVLPVQRIVHIASQVASALGAVHSAGVIHRDLKPANIFLTERAGRAEFVKVLDFGVAKLLYNVLGQNQHKTALGTLLGTPEYMAPEQALGRAVDHRADIYAFGVLLYELVTGERPFVARSIEELLSQHVTKPPTPPSVLVESSRPVPAALESLILHCLQKDPADRPSSMQEINDRLESLLGPAPQTAPVVRPPEASRRSHAPHSRASRVLLILGSVLAIVAAGLTVVGSLSKGIPQPKPEPALREVAREPMPREVATQAAFRLESPTPAADHGREPQPITKPKQESREEPRAERTPKRARKEEAPRERKPEVESTTLEATTPTRKRAPGVAEDLLLDPFGD